MKYSSFPRLVLFALFVVPVFGVRGESVAPQLGTPFAEEAYWAPVMAYPGVGSLHGVWNLNCAGVDITPHGLLLEDRGLMVQPYLALCTPLHADPTQWLGSVTWTLGGWANWHSHEGGEAPAHWREVDLFSGLTFVIEGNWKLSAFYAAYISQTQSYATAWDFALALSYDDTAMSGNFALRPFLEFKQQTQGTTTMAFRQAGAEESYSLRLGIIPQHQFDGFKLEAPVFFTLVPKGFYRRSTTIRDSGYEGVRANGYQIDDWQPAAGGCGFLSAALKLSVPMDIISTTDVRTSVYAAFQYYRIINDGLLDTNQAIGARDQRQHNLFQLHLGLNTTF